MALLAYTTGLFLYTVTPWSFLTPVRGEYMSLVTKEASQPDRQSTNKSVSQSAFDRAKEKEWLRHPESENAA